MVIKVPKRRFVIYVLVILFSILSIYQIINVCHFEKKKYLVEYDKVVNREFKGPSAPRGRILDVNGKVLVDNVGVDTLVYNKINGIKTKDEIDIALKLADIIGVEEDKITESRLKTFYLVLHNGGDDLITKKEKKLLKERKLTRKEIDKLKLDRISEDMLNSMSETERKASYIYYLLSKGYAYQNKIIKKGLSEEEVAHINDLNLKGISTVLTWERIYPYGEVLRSIFGSISNNTVPKELKDYYLDKGLSLDSTVGTSFLEFQYDDYLRGTDALYHLGQTGKIELLSEEKQGNDLYLTIDIDKQIEIENILKAEMLTAKKAKNTKFYNHSYVIVGHPLTGEIVAMSGQEISKDHFIDITSNIISSSYTVGSIVKGGSMSVGYHNNLIDKGKYVTDSCVKVYGVQKKCSWKSLGRIDDIRAMALSSNYYQFLIAIKMTNPAYSWNSKLNATEEHFKKYRDMYASYGLGAMTGIDLPGEKLGIIGSRVSDDLLLNLSIGQYDTYTPIEVFQYVNTLANNGVRIAPSLMSKITDGDKVIKENEKKVLNEAMLSDENMKRVQEGLREVMISGTGKNYTDKSIPSAGKTGTSETFVDSDADGKMDTKTISNAFIMYAPFDNPEYSVVIVSPNISVSDGDNSYKYAINLRLNQKIFKYLFEKQ